MVDFDLIVVGGGHAGYEAAAVAVRRGVRTLLVSGSRGRLGWMSCNPAVGGLAKGQLVREVDALGGIIGRCADRSGIQFRTLNRGRGPAVRATRTQNDRARFAAEVRRELEGLEQAPPPGKPPLALLDGEVTGVVTERGAVAGVAVRGRGTITARRVVLACGTFLNGLIHVGGEQWPAGRLGEEPARGLTESLVALGIRTARLKTGTPPRLDGRTIDYARMIRQDGDVPPPFFALETAAPLLPQLPCHLTHTTRETKRIIESSLDRSPLYSGRIKGIGPRYCPSIEDKIVRFPHHETHQIFIEPEGIETDEVYVNGSSTSLPFDVQEYIIKSIDGLEDAKIVKYGYAIEYDFFPPEQVSLTLQSRLVFGLYFAGQINGTSGYEEAAAQGMVAGLNAALSLAGEDEFVPRRDESYIGVLIDDLVTKGTDEPYRMFTSRAEYRLRLREDNAIFRLHKYALKYGTVDQARVAAVAKLEKEIADELRYLRSTRTERSIAAKLAIDNDEGKSLYDIAKRHEIGYHRIRVAAGRESEVSTRAADYIESEAKYSGYLIREERLNDRSREHSRIRIPADIDYAVVGSLSSEGRNKLKALRPVDLGQASRISGVSPADINVLRIFLAGRK